MLEPRGTNDKPLRFMNGHRPHDQLWRQQQSRRSEHMCYGTRSGGLAISDDCDSQDEFLVRSHSDPKDTMQLMQELGVERNQEDDDDVMSTTQQEGIAAPDFRRHRNLVLYDVLKAPGLDIEKTNMQFINVFEVTRSGEAKVVTRKGQNTRLKILDAIVPINVFVAPTKLHCNSGPGGSNTKKNARKQVNKQQQKQHAKDPADVAPVSIENRMCTGWGWIPFLETEDVFTSNTTTIDIENHARTQKRWQAPSTMSRILIHHSASNQPILPLFHYRVHYSDNPTISQIHYAHQIQLVPLPCTRINIMWLLCYVFGFTNDQLLSVFRSSGIHAAQLDDLFLMKEPIDNRDSERRAIYCTIVDALHKFEEASIETLRSMENIGEGEDQSRNQDIMSKEILSTMNACSEKLSSAMPKKKSSSSSSSTKGPDGSQKKTSNSLIPLSQIFINNPIVAQFFGGKRFALLSRYFPTQWLSGMHLEELDALYNVFDREPLRLAFPGTRSWIVKDAAALRTAAAKPNRYPSYLIGQRNEVGDWTEMFNPARYDSNKIESMIRETSGTWQMKYVHLLSMVEYEWNRSKAVQRCPGMTLEHIHSLHEERCSLAIMFGIQTPLDDFGSVNGYNDLDISNDPFDQLLCSDIDYDPVLIVASCIFTYVYEAYHVDSHMCVYGPKMYADLLSDKEIGAIISAISNLKLTSATVFTPTNVAKAMHTLSSRTSIDTVNSVLTVTHKDDNGGFNEISSAFVRPNQKEISAFRQARVDMFLNHYDELILYTREAYETEAMLTFTLNEIVRESRDRFLRADGGVPLQIPDLDTKLYEMNLGCDHAKYEKDNGRKCTHTCSEQIQIPAYIKANVPVFTVTGPGGCGKTAMMELIAKMFGSEHVLFLGFMGAHVSNMRARIPGIRASTIHRMTVYHSMFCSKCHVAGEQLGSAANKFTNKDMQDILCGEYERSADGKYIVKAKDASNGESDTKEMYDPEETRVSMMHHSANVRTQRALGRLIADCINKRPNDDVLLFNPPWKECPFEDIRCVVFEESSTKNSSLLLAALTPLRCCAQLSNVILAGDAKQLSPVTGDEVQDAIIDGFGTIKFEHSHRFDTETRELTDAIAAGDSSKVKPKMMIPLHSAAARVRYNHRPEEQRREYEKMLEQGVFMYQVAQRYEGHYKVRPKGPGSNQQLMYDSIADVIQTCGLCPHDTQFIARTRRQCAMNQAVVCELLLREADRRYNSGRFFASVTGRVDEERLEKDIHIGSKRAHGDALVGPASDDDDTQTEKFSLGQSRDGKTMLVVGSSRSRETVQAQANELAAAEAARYKYMRLHDPSTLKRGELVTVTGNYPALSLATNQNFLTSVILYVRPVVVPPTAEQIVAREENNSRSGRDDGEKKNNWNTSTRSTVASVIEEKMHDKAVGDKSWIAESVLMLMSSGSQLSTAWSSAVTSNRSAETGNIRPQSATLHNAHPWLTEKDLLFMLSAIAKGHCTPGQVGAIIHSVCSDYLMSLATMTGDCDSSSPLYQEANKILDEDCELCMRSMEHETQKRRYASSNSGKSNSHSGGYGRGHARSCQARKDMPFYLSNVPPELISAVARDESKKQHGGKHDYMSFVANANLEDIMLQVVQVRPISNDCIMTAPYDAATEAPIFRIAMALPIGSNIAHSDSVLRWVYSGPSEREWSEDALRARLSKSLKHHMKLRVERRLPPVSTKSLSLRYIPLEGKFGKITRPGSVNTIHAMQGNQRKNIVYITEYPSKYDTCKHAYAATTRSTSRTIVLGNKEAFMSAIETPPPVRNSELGKALYHLVYLPYIAPIFKKHPPDLAYAAKMEILEDGCYGTKTLSLCGYYLSLFKNVTREQLQQEAYEDRSRIMRCMTRNLSISRKRKDRHIDYPDTSITTASNSSAADDDNAMDVDMPIPVENDIVSDKIDATVLVTPTCDATNDGPIDNITIDDDDDDDDDVLSTTQEVDGFDVTSALDTLELAINKGLSDLYSADSNDSAESPAGTFNDMELLERSATQPFSLLSKQEREAMRTDSMQGIKVWSEAPDYVCDSDDESILHHSTANMAWFTGDSTIQLGSHQQGTNSSDDDDDDSASDVDLDALEHAIAEARATL